MAGKQKRKPIAESNGGLEDWLMPDYTRSAVMVGLAPVVGMISLFVMHNVLVSSMLTVLLASPAIITPIVKHVLKKVETQIALRDQELGNWAEETERGIQEFRNQQREKIADFETRMLGLVSKVLERDPTMKVDIDAVIGHIRASREGQDPQKPTVVSPDQGPKGKESDGLGGPG